MGYVLYLIPVPGCGGSVDCIIRHKAHNKADTALPIQWLQDVIRVLGDDYRDVRQHIYWDYSPPFRVMGAPRAQCPEAQEILDAYYTKLGCETPVFT